MENCIACVCTGAWQKAVQEEEEEEEERKGPAGWEQ